MTTENPEIYNGLTDEQWLECLKKEIIFAIGDINLKHGHTILEIVKSRIQQKNSSILELGQKIGAPIVDVSVQADAEQRNTIASKIIEGSGERKVTQLPVAVVEGYEELSLVFVAALNQAQKGKGAERHQVGGASFIKQPICELTRIYGLAYPFGQAAKKTHEVSQLTAKGAKLAEILGALNYLAAAYIVIDEG